MSKVTLSVTLTRATSPDGGGIPITLRIAVCLPNFSLSSGYQIRFMIYQIYFQEDFSHGSETV